MTRSRPAWALLPALPALALLSGVASGFGLGAGVPRAKLLLRPDAAGILVTDVVRPSARWRGLSAEASAAEPPSLGTNGTSTATAAADSIQGTESETVAGPLLSVAAAGSDWDSGSGLGSQRPDLNRPRPSPSLPVVLWRFTRPHTLIGSALAIPALHLLAAPTLGSAFTARNLLAVLFAMIPSLLMNLYITGLNQITDVEIDRINKPYLPIAAGDLSPRAATAVVLAALTLSLGMGASHPVLGSQGLNVALWGSALLGTMYSLPPFRLKRFPLLAAFCIVAVRGTIINAGFFAHATAAAFGGAGQGAASMSTSVLGCLLNDPRCRLSSAFFGVFGIVIALMKDVPDVGGDREFGIRSFSVRVGQRNVFMAMRRLLTALFLAFGAGFLRAACFAPTKFLAVCRAGVGAAALAAGLSARREAESVDPEDSAEVYTYYMHLWKLFYMSYLVLPFAR